MTNLEHIKSMTIDEFAELLDECGLHEDAPWSKWFDDNYCQNCELITEYVECLNRNVTFSYCEFNDYMCRFFPKLDEVPDNKQIIEMWLESEYKE